MKSKRNIRIDNITKNVFDKAHREYQGVHNEVKITQANFLLYLLEVYEKNRWENTK